MAEKAVSFKLEASLTNTEGQLVGRVQLATHVQQTAAGSTEAKPAAGSMRELMPQTADVVDWLRGFLGADKANERLAAAKRGEGGFYSAEIGPDGVLREYGSTDDGTRCVLDDQRRIRWVDRNGRINA
jgi:hypothetical protein